MKINKIKCKCGHKIEKLTTRFTISTQYNPILNCDIYYAQLYYNTFCPRCGELVSGVDRKLLDIKDIEKIFGVKRDEEN